MPFKCDLVPYIIDSKIVAIVINTHNETVRMARRLFSGIDAVAYNSENDYIGGYGYGYTVNCIIWRTHEYFQKEISDRADNEENWLVDGQGVTLRSRNFMVPYNFKATAVQWRNCQPGDKYYSAKPNIVPNDGRSPEIMQIAYLTLDTPMEEGSTHTLEWCGNTC
jgi:hypothetical protein